jgi:hypothetical protein
VHTSSWEETGETPLSIWSHRSSCYNGARDGGRAASSRGRAHCLRACASGARRPDRKTPSSKPRSRGVQSREHSCSRRTFPVELMSAYCPQDRQFAVADKPCQNVVNEMQTLGFVLYIPETTSWCDLYKSIKITTDLTTIS